MADVKTVNIEQADIDRIKKFRTMYSQTISQIGEVEVERLNLEMMLEQLSATKDNLEQTFKSLKQEESRLTSDFQEKYGNGEFDIEAGTFTPVQ